MPSCPGAIKALVRTRNVLPTAWTNSPYCFGSAPAAQLVIDWMCDGHLRVVRFNLRLQLCELRRITPLLQRLGGHSKADRQANQEQAAQHAQQKLWAECVQHQGGENRATRLRHQNRSAQ
jgi:hypothetical protein